MRIILFIFLVAMALPSGATAGAWPRPKGDTFVSVAQESTTGARTLLDFTQDIRTYLSIYGEHGLTDRLTLGVDLATGMGEDDRFAAGLAFARYPIRSPGAHVLAVELGLGSIYAETEGQQLRLRPGLAWGRGFASRWGAGWLGVESSVEFRQPSGDTLFKADFTAGLKPTDAWMMIGQVQVGAYPDGALVRLTPSVVRRVGERTHLELGLLAEVQGGSAFGLRGALWFDF